MPKKIGRSPANAGNSLSTERTQLMEISALAGKPAPKNMLVDLARLEREYYERRPDIGDPDQLVSFGTSGHRGSSLRDTFTKSHILALTPAIRHCRRPPGISR